MKTTTEIPKAVPDDELAQWAELRADDAGRLARELIQYRALRVHQPCPECGSNLWMHEMGDMIELRHFRGCSKWDSYFDGGNPRKA